ncbi:hypothetical protein V5799_030884 [Amblyomma americanum]|uniref:Uncharacterized protein n=1 Tax=Amblyomma americanum TaxID=6943 RepID=A0AAQ4EM35_AMBAM
MDQDKEGAVVKVVQVGYKLDETVRSLPVVRMIFGYGLVVVFMAIAINAGEADEILRSISSGLVGLIALKSPLSRRLCLYLLCVTGVQVGRVLVSVMLLVFLVSMVVDATMTTGILAGFVDPLIFEIYANNLRIRYAAHMRSDLKAPDASVTEVDFMFKDTAKHRSALGTTARMGDTVQLTQEDWEEPVFALDSRGNIRQLILYVDRKEEGAHQVRSGAASPLPQDLAENPDMRREQVTEALRTFGVDLSQLGLKLELEEEVSELLVLMFTGIRKPIPGTPDQSLTAPQKDGADVEDGKNAGSRQKQKGQEAKAAVSGKGQSSKAQDETVTHGGKDSGKEVDASSTLKTTASKTSKKKAKKKGLSGGAGSSSAPLTTGVTKSLSKNTTQEDSAVPQQHVQFSHVLYWDRTPSVASASRGDAETGSTSGTLFSKEPAQCFYVTEHRQQVYRKGNPSVSASPRLRLHSSAARGGKKDVISTGKRASDDVEDDSGSSAGRSQSSERPRFVDTSFGVSESKRYFVVDFSGRVPSGRRERSRRHKDVIKSKRKLLRRKRKSTDLTAEERVRSEGEPRAILPDHRGDFGGDSSRRTRRQPREKPWVERVDESATYNPFLATDVSFRLRRSLSKPGLLWKLGRYCAERGDSLRNLLLARHQQVFATADTDRGADPETPLNQLENKDRDSLSSGVDWQPEEDDEMKSSRPADKDRSKGDHEGDQGGGAPNADGGEALGGLGTEGSAKAHEYGLGGARELEAIILEEKENIDLPDVSLNYSTWLLVHVPFCLMLMIIAAMIINFVHTRD